MIVYITRHGQPSFPPPEIEEDPEFPSGDRPLSALGREQARLLGRRLAASGFRGLIFSSPYRRTAMTADLIAEALGSTFVPAAPIREIVTAPNNIRDFRGLTIEALRLEFQQVAPDATLHYPWWTADAEENQDVRARVGPFIDWLVANTRRDVLLVGHGASAGAATRHLLARCTTTPEEIPLTWNCALTAFRCDGVADDGAGACELLLLQDTRHLPDEQVTSNATFRNQADEESPSAEV